MQFHVTVLKTTDITGVLFPSLGMIGFGTDNYGDYSNSAFLSAGDTRHAAFLVL
jgi:hypothetical protein